MRTKILIALSGAVALAGISACAGETTDSAAVETTTTTSPSAAALSCDGEGVDDDAQIRYRTETLIDAPLSTVWDVHTDVDGWADWQQPVTSMQRLDSGQLEPGSQFRWTTPAPATAITPATTLTITSTVQQMEPQACIRWSGPAVGDGLSIDNGIHVWTFEQIDDGVLVRTEETWTGEQLEADVPMSTTFLGAGLDAWLVELKSVAEAETT